ncbi:hypothetical protein M432DRAFT_433839 [Thermoascus aurantiacus ATCC 26904]
MHATTIILIITAVLAYGTAVTADLILAAAPVSKILGAEGDLFPRQDLSCPEITQTVCPDGNGCCPRGAACTYSSGLAVCDVPCGAGPRCAYGGCCEVGYMCNPSRGGNCLVATSTGFDFSVPTLTVPSLEPTGTGSGDDDSGSDSFPSTLSPASSSSVASSTSSFSPSRTPTPASTTGTPRVTSTPESSSASSPSPGSESTSSESSSTAASGPIGAAHSAAPFSDYWSTLILGWLARMLF